MKITNLDITKESMDDAMGISDRRQFELREAVEEISEKLIDEVNDFSHDNRRTQKNMELEGESKEAIRAHHKKYLNRYAELVSKANVISKIAEVCETPGELIWGVLAGLRLVDKINKEVHKQVEHKFGTSTGKGSSSRKSQLDMLQEMLDMAKDMEEELD